METKLLALAACILLASLLLMIFTWEKGGMLMKSLKTIVLYGFAAIFLVGLLILFSGVFSDEKTSDLTKKPLDNSFQGFSETLWQHWGMTIVIVSFIGTEISTYSSCRG
jgi:hypothetical protein